jgi:ABC-type branched-subunit amino acid transport system substrate-binding protein
MSRKATRWSAGIAVLTAACALAASVQAAGGAVSKLRVAILVPTGGYFAVHNGLIANGAEIAAAESGSGPEVGALKVSLVRERLAPGADPRTVMTSLSRRGIGVVILPCNVDSTPALARAGARQKLLMLSPCNPSPKPALSTPMLWPTGMAGNAEVAQIVNYARSNNATTAYLLTAREPSYVSTLAGYFREAAKLSGVKIVASSAVPLKGADVAALAKDIQRSKARAIFTPIFSPHLQPIVAGLRARGLIQPVYATDGLDAQQLLSRYAKPMEGLFYGSFGFPRAESQRFFADYSARFRKQAVGSFPGLGYETIRVLVAAAEQADSSTPSSIDAAFGNGFTVIGVALGDVRYRGRGSKLPFMNAGMARIVRGQPHPMFASDPAATLRIPAP